jgi:hypothetical protein
MAEIALRPLDLNSSRAEIVSTPEAGEAPTMVCNRFEFNDEDTCDGRADNLHFAGPG